MNVQSNFHRPNLNEDMHSEQWSVLKYFFHKLLFVRLFLRNYCKNIKNHIWILTHPFYLEWMWSYFLFDFHIKFLQSLASALYIIILCFFAAPIQFKFSVLQLNWIYSWWCVTKHLLGNYFLWDYFKRNIVKSCAYLFDWLMNIKIKFEFWYIFLILIECDPFFSNFHMA